MSVFERVAIGLGVVAVVALAAQVASLRRAVRKLSAAVEDQGVELADLRQQTVPLLADTRSALRKADRDNRKADALLDVATSLTGTADAASRLAYRAVTNPIVKVAAFATGTKRAAKEMASPTPPPDRRRFSSARSGSIRRQKAIEVESTQRPQGPVA